MFDKYLDIILAVCSFIIVFIPAYYVVKSMLDLNQKLLNIFIACLCGLLASIFTYYVFNAIANSF